MFINCLKRRGSVYYEFQYCKINEPVKGNKVNSKIVKNWAEDSLVINDELWDKFYALHGEAFDGALLTSGKKGFYKYGLNYYDKEATMDVIMKLKDSLEEKYANLLPWLAEAIDKYNGFYIIGI